MRIGLHFLVIGCLGCFGVGLFVACADEDGCGPVATHDADIQPIWSDNCLSAGDANCHIEDGGHDMHLTEGDAYDALVGVFATATMGATDMDFVAPGDPESSYLLHKLRGTHFTEARGDGKQMPCAELDAASDGCSMAGEPLSDAQIQLIEDWICNGAER